MNRRKRRPTTTHGVSKARLEALVEEATIGAYGESEQVGGFYTMIDENLRLPSSTEILGVEVTVEKVDLTDADEIVVTCRRGTARQRISILMVSRCNGGRKECLPERYIALRISKPSSCVPLSNWSPGDWSTTLVT
jgi:hypothetical protein